MLIHTAMDRTSESHLDILLPRKLSILQPLPEYDIATVKPRTLDPATSPCKRDKGISRSETTGIGDT